MTKFFLTTAVTALLTLSAIGQNTAAPKPKLGPSAALLASWNDIGRKLIAMAEDFPEDKYDFKPTPAQRSFAEQLLHVAGSNDLYTDVAKGKKPVDDELREHYKTKAAVVAYLKKSFADGASAIQQKGDKRNVGDGRRTRRRTNCTSPRPRLRCDRALRANTTANWLCTTASRGWCRQSRGHESRVHDRDISPRWYHVLRAERDR